MKTLKQQFETSIANTVQAVEDGEFSAMEAMGNFKIMHDFLKQAIEQIEGDAMNEFDLECQGGKTIKNFKGFEVTVRGGGWTYDFSNVKEYSDLMNEKKELEAKYKAIMEHQNSVDATTGEVLDIRKKPKKDSISFKLSK